MSRAQRGSVSFDGDPRGRSCSRNLVPMLLLTSLFFASSAAVISCPSGGGPCSPMDLRAALNRSRQSFATCDAAAPPSQVPPPVVVQQEAAATAAAKRAEESAQPPVTEQAATAAPPAADAAAAATEPASASAADAQPQIATFDEWTKAKLQQPPPVAAVVPPLSATGGVPSNGATAPAAGGAAVANDAAPRVIVVPPASPEAAAAATAATTRNYASRECGAKVIYANPEAENTKAVLNDKEKDDYMRNPCDKAQHKHVVIELCETIQPRSIEIANFELFSSGPAAVRFSAAERFPSQQWSVLGEWSIADVRTVQTLPVPAEKLTYAKFIKLELLAHHGSEHFCTLSTVRVLGVSMVDEYEAEAVVVAARIAAPHAAAAAPAPEVPVVAAVPPPVEQQQQKKEEPPIPAESTTPAASPTITEAPPISVVEAPPTTAKELAADAAGGGGIVQEVMSGTLLKKIIEVVGGARGKAQAPSALQQRARGSAYAACDRTPAAGWPNATSPRRAFFCPPVSAKPAARPLTPAQLTAARRAQARRSLIAATQRREEEAARAAALPPTQIEAPPQRKATTTPVVQQPPAAAAAPPTKEEEPPAAAKPQQQQPPAAAPATPQAQQQPPTPPVGIFEGLAAGTSSHKESVFMKLNKRIAALELNMSLSTEYLSELSRQYIAQTEEQKRAMERTRIAAERAAVDVARTVNETMRDELFNLRKEVDALSAWLASLRVQAGSVALARRISGADAAGPEMSAAAASDRTTAEVGHRRRHQTMIDEDYVSYDESYETVCPYRTQQGRAYGPQPRPEREDGNAHEADDEEHSDADADADAFDLRHFRHHSDGIWTTEQVLYAVLGAQALTVVLVLAMQACYARVWPRRPAQPVQQQQPAAAAPPPAPAVDAAELERMINAALERRAEREREAAQPPPHDPVVAAAAASASEASPRSSASSVTSSSGGQQQAQQSGGKKKRRQRRSTVEQPAAAAHHHHHQCRQCGGGPDGALDWDSAMDSSLPSPSQSGSEEEFEAPPPTSGASQAPPTSGSGSLQQSTAVSSSPKS
ncbi:hypothetical protein PMAYCL1PPCAC_01087 [Pristionchus mayeri]|uniref:SUN domain-containing protein n=1 Tax=Pristionchus mayeri TaxID=1317129 RepID=A0AAN4YXQ4_9BILA|nr:hypothetical protein PMAYCL1PPCAC_01087 [Pristionchus mayeri]